MNLLYTYIYNLTIEPTLLLSINSNLERRRSQLKTIDIKP
jgi:hypothetical protein